VSGKVVAITSGKGGVGKSTTALNVGATLGADGHSVVLVDADLGMANIEQMLGLRSDHTLHGVLAGEADVTSVITTARGAFDVVPGGRDLGEYAKADPDRLPGVLATLRERYEYILVDAGAGLGYADVVPIEAADEVVLVTTPTDTAIGDTAKIAEFSDRIDAEVRGVVITRARGETDPETMATRVGAELLCVIPEDPNVSESAKAEVPLEQHAPDSPAGIAYDRLAGVISGQSEGYAGAEVVYPGGTEHRDTGSGGGRAPTENPEPSPGEDRTPGGTGLPEIEGQSDRDGGRESNEDSTDGTDNDDPDDESRGGLLSRLRNLL
jgi:septum site-determining protein MinD